MLWMCALASAAMPTPVAPAETLTLEQAVERFRQDSPMAAASAAQIDEAKSMAWLAAARMLPVVSAHGRYVRNNAEAIVSLGNLLEALPQLPDTVEVPDDLVIQPLDQWSGGVDVQVPLVVPGAWGEQRAAQRGVELVVAGTEVVNLQGEVGLRTAAWMAWGAEQTVDATRAGVVSAETHRDSAKRLSEAGLGTELDVLQAEAEVLRRQGLHAQAVADLDASRRNVGVLLGLQGPVNVEVGEMPALPQETAAVVDHPEQRAVEAKRELAAQSRRAAQLTHVPNLSAFANAAVSDVPFPTGQTSAWSVGAQARWILFDGGARYARAGRAGAQLDSTEAERWRVDTDLARRLADASEAAQVSEVQLHLAEKGVEVARAAEATSGRLFESGIGDSLTVLDSQQRRMEAEVGLAAATARLAVARIALQSLDGR